MVRMACLALLLIQVLPLFGIISLPAMAMVHDLIYSKAMKNLRLVPQPGSS